MEIFGELEENDILFIDSSHMIRPEGDVLFEYLEILPSLAKGVIVHIHDIFSPRNYPKQWLVDEVRFWNEQYFLEAFLSHNRSGKIIAALNYLQHNHPETLKSVAPYLTPIESQAQYISNASTEELVTYLAPIIIGRARAKVPRKGCLAFRRAALVFAAATYRCPMLVLQIPADRIANSLRKIVGRPPT